MLQDNPENSKMETTYRLCLLCFLDLYLILFDHFLDDNDLGLWWLLLAALGFTLDGD